MIIRIANHQEFTISLQGQSAGELTTPDTTLFIEFSNDFTQTLGKRTSSFTYDTSSHPRDVSTPTSHRIGYLAEPALITSTPNFETLTSVKRLTVSPKTKVREIRDARRLLSTEASTLIAISKSYDTPHTCVAIITDATTSNALDVEGRLEDMYAGGWSFYQVDDLFSFLIDLFKKNETTFQGFYTKNSTRLEVSPTYTEFTELSPQNLPTNATPGSSASSLDDHCDASDEEEQEDTTEHVITF
jgi:hypothetical protein